MSQTRHLGHLAVWKSGEPLQVAFFFLSWQLQVADAWIPCSIHRILKLFAKHSRKCENTKLTRWFCHWFPSRTLCWRWAPACKSLISLHQSAQYLSECIWYRYKTSFTRSSRICLRIQKLPVRLIFPHQPTNNWQLHSNADFLLPNSWNKPPWSWFISGIVARER